MFYWVLFENVMSFHRTKATIIGLLEAARVNEWVVTEKLGDTLKAKSKSGAPRRSLTKILGDRYIYYLTVYLEVLNNIFGTISSIKHQ